MRWVRRAAILVAAFVGFVAARRWLLTGTLAAGTALAATTLTLNVGDPGGGEAPAGTAHLWVDTTGGSCLRSASPDGYVDGEACSSLDAAQDASSGGDTVRIVDGTYGAQDITGSKASTVTYIGESKAGVVFTGALGLETNVTIHDVTVSNDSHNFEAIIPDNTVDAKLVNVDALGDYVSVEVYAVTRFQWIGGSFGDFDGSIQERHCAGSPDVAAGDKLPFRIGENSVGPILIEGMHFSEMDATNESDGTNGCSGDNFHLEVWRIDDAVDDVTFRNNIIDQCPGCNTALILVSNHGDGPPEDLSFVGNMLENGKVFEIETFACVNYLFAYNSIEGTWSAINCSSYTNMRWVGNIVRHPGFGTPSCSNATFTDNVWQAGGDPGCNTGDDSGNEWVADDGGSSCNINNPCVDNLGFLSDTDLHLTGSSPAVNSGETPGASDICTDTSIMGTTGDVDGDVRPLDSVCDAGADERDD
jgi:hypothetical protein